MVVTESDLRRRALAGEKSLRLAEGDILTPAARDYARQQGLVVQPAAGQADAAAAAVAPPGAGAPRGQVMDRAPVPMVNGKPLYVDESGRTYGEKPEHMTHLHGNVLVEKSHPRIAFRGEMDLLQADILSAQVQAKAHGWAALADDLGNALSFARAVLGSEVKEEPLPFPPLLGYTDGALREVSHHPERHFGIPHLVPDARMGPVVAGLNRLRAETRRCELSAMAVFSQPGGGISRADLVQALNRLSSGFYILMCRVNSGFYTRNRPE